MATATERLALIIDADAKGAVRELKSLGLTAEKELGKPQATIDKVSAGLTRYGVAATVTGGAVAAGLRIAAEATQDLADSKDKADAVFGDTKALDSFAADAATNLGKSKAAALDAASVFGNIGKAAGVGGQQLVTISTELATRAADLAEQQKKSYSDVESAIIAGLNGRGKALKSLGVDLSEAKLQEVAYAEGIAASGDKLTAQQRYLAAYKTILDQTSSAQRFFAKSTDDMGVAQAQANAEFENAKAALGEAALPAMTAAASVAGDLLGAFNDLPGPIREVAGAIAATGAGVAIAGGALATVAGQAIKAVQWFRATAAARTEAAAAAVAASEAEIVAVRALEAAQVQAATAATADAAAQARLAEVSTLAMAAQTRLAVALEAQATAALSGVGAEQALATAQVEVAAAAQAAAAARARLATVTNTAAAASERAAVAATAEAEAQAAATVAMNGAAGAAGRLGSALGAVKSVAAKGLLAAGITDLAFNIINGLTDVEQESSDALDRLGAMLDDGAKDIVTTFNGRAAEAERATLKWGHLVTVLTDNSFKLGGVGAEQNVSDLKAAFDKLLDTDPAAAQKLVDSVRELDKELSKNDTNRVQSESLLKIWQAAIDDATAKQKANTGATDDGTDALDGNTDALKKNADELAKVSASDIVNDYLDLVEATDRVTEASNSRAKAAENEADAVRSVASANRDLRSAQRNLADKQADLSELQTKFARVDPTKNPNLYRDLQDQLRNALNDVADAQDRVLDASDRVAGAEDDLKDARGQSLKAAEDARKAEIDLARARLAQVEAAQKLAADSAALAQNPQTAKDEITRIAQLRDAGLIDKPTADAIIGQLLRAIAAAQGTAASQGVFGSAKGTAPGYLPPGATPENHPTGPYLPGSPPAPSSQAPPALTGAGPLQPGQSRADQVRDKGAFLRQFPTNPEKSQSFTIGGQNFIWTGSKWVGGDANKAFATWQSRGYRDGGLIPGTGDRDSVPAMLMPGEFVIRKKAAAAIGIDNLDRLNRADSLPRFATGGPVGKVAALAPTLAARDLPRSDNGDVVAAIGRLEQRLSAIEVNETIAITQVGDPGKFPDTGDTVRGVRAAKHLARR